MTTYVMRNGSLVDKTTGEPMVSEEERRAFNRRLARGEDVAPQVAPDIQPYKSMITGERIRSRSHHRQHLRDHGCIEVGNEPPPKAPPRPTAIKSDERKRMLYQAFDNVTDRQARSRKKFDVRLPDKMVSLLKGQ
jgi:hypothetical protein